MKPRFVDQRLISIPKPGWKPAGKAPTPAPHIIVIAYLDTDGRPWLYDDDLGLRRLDAPDEP
jgi:hypothetical protein